MKDKMLSPLLLTSRLGPFPQFGSVASATPLEIVNPNKTPMLVDQLRFTLSDPSSGNNFRAFTSLRLTQYLIEVMLGSIPITKRAVTLGALAPRYIGSPQPTAELTDNPTVDGTLTWHLPTPLYVPPNVQLVINALRRPGYPGEPVGQLTPPSLLVSVVGRSLPSNLPVPGSIEIPYVVEWRQEQPQLRSVSADHDLVNTTDVPFNVTQFVGVNVAPPVTQRDGTNPTRDEHFTVQMSLSNGTMLIRDQVPFFLVFPADRGILPVSARLQPGEFVRAELNAGDPDAEQYSRGTATTAIAMHGYRKVQTPGTIG